MQATETAKATTGLPSGKVTQVLGAVVDVEFPPGKLPAIFTALKVTNPSISNKPWNLTLEIAQHLGDNVVRTIALDSTDGLARGLEVQSTGDVIRLMQDLADRVLVNGRCDNAIAADQRVRREQ